MLTRRAVLALIVLSGSGIMATESAALEALQWQKRVIVLFAKSRSDARLDKQLDLLASRRSDLDERKLVVITVTEISRTPQAVTSFGYTRLEPSTGRELVRRFVPASSGLTVLLVGLDGTEKGRWQGTVDPQLLFDLVDTMPMRQSETGTRPATN